MLAAGPSHRETGTYMDEGGALRALSLYRYLSWGLTSAFCLLSSPQETFPLNLTMVIALLFAGYYACGLYSSPQTTKRIIFIAMIAETFGIALLLVPTGGLDSPFIWYALNPIMIAALLLPGIFCWTALGCFSIASFGSSVLLYGKSAQELWQDRLLLVLVLVLVTASSHLFSYLIMGLRRSNQQLSSLHQQAESLLQHTKALYLALESFAGEGDPAHLASMLSAYAMQLTYSRGGACLLTGTDGSLTLKTSSEPVVPGLAEAVMPIMDSSYNLAPDDRDRTLDWPVEVGGKQYTLSCRPIRTDSHTCGLLAILNDCPSKSAPEVERTMEYLAGLGALALDRYHMNESARRLLIAEEQNRIANEIHDGVAQYLFSAAYALQGLIGRQGELQDQHVQEQLRLVQATATKATKELRASIYRLSPVKRGEQVFSSTLSAYLSDVGKLNCVNVELGVEGIEDVLSPALRQALYRIVREATANAIRHGRCGSIRVQLSMLPERTRLQVLDDGLGFDVDSLDYSGLGIANMKCLMASFGGSFHIDSTPGLGTSVLCAVPADD